MENNILTVHNITSYLRNTIKRDDNLVDLCILGEISNYSESYTGHCYFTLKDEKAQLSCVLFKSKKDHVKFKLEDGMKVVAKGYIDIYEPWGKYQLNITDVTKEGAGELNVAFEELKKKLEKEGLFDKSHKKAIPKYPKRIGVVTSKTGAAIRDIIKTIEQRYPLCEILLFPTLVQGDLAKYKIVEQIRRAQNYNLDTLIIGRGGGSIEDLWPFNEEIVAREIYDCSIPVISAVGHEVDFTISDFVADYRALTPTAAAQYAVPDIVDMKNKIRDANSKLIDNMEDRLFYSRNKLDELSSKPMFRNPEKIYEYKRIHLDHLIKDFKYVSKSIVDTNRKELFKLENSAVLKNPHLIMKNKKEKYLRNLGKLEVLNPLLTLKRGYSITKCDDKIVSSVKDVKKGDKLDIEFDDGTIHTKVI